MNNIHRLDDYSTNGPVGIQSSNASGKDDRIWVSSIYKIRTVTALILFLNISIYILQIIAFW